MLGIWIAVVVGLQVSGMSGMRSFSSDASAGDRVRVVSVMGRSEHTSRATAFQGADVTNVMGRSELDLRDATLAPGANATVHVFSAMGAVVLRVPPTWTVDTGAISAIGGVRDERFTLPEAEAAAGPAPRLVLRGLVHVRSSHDHLIRTERAMSMDNNELERGSLMTPRLDRRRGDRALRRRAGARPPEPGRRRSGAAAGGRR